MNSPVAPLSTREVIVFFSVVSIVSISTFNLREAAFSSAAKMIYFSGKAFSHFGFWILGIIIQIWAGSGPGTESSFKVNSGFCMSDEIVLGSHIFAGILKKLHKDNKGMLFTHYLVQNPSGLPLQLLQEGLLSLPCPF